ncbi:anthranilate synthase, component II [Methanococcoides vulcani]|uniref:anthranilate synthase n=1 Tax=Methanococcoides vulcani TaxID=1353158 RepID=A0A1I0BBH5_9EURY|nr:aminodeoxychorismate/anthranilate synthase component II [Methanococcoides vulcani]SET04176.1 anthranilate synthase, component II [Methanococcoides vulcani]
MKVLFVNNRDSFVWNLVDYVSMFESDTLVVPNTISVDEVREISPDAIVISPGPGNPGNSRDVGSCIEIIHEFGDSIPILGVCFGHQAINAAFGGTINHSKGGPVHGKASMVIHNTSSMFDGISTSFYAGRYHSLSVDRMADDLEITAQDENGLIMGIKHKEYPIYGVQFHPESVLTPEGLKLIENFLKIAGMGTKD